MSEAKSSKLKVTTKKTKKVTKKQGTGTPKGSKKTPKAKASKDENGEEKTTKKKVVKKKKTADGETPKTTKKKTKSTDDEGTTKKKTGKTKATPKSTGKKKTKGAADTDSKAASTKKKKKQKADSPPPIPEVKVDLKAQRAEIQAAIKSLKSELLTEKRKAQRGEAELESMKRGFCIKKAMQSHINDATMREHDELIEDMIDMLYEYEERIEQYEVLAESFAENFEDGKSDLAFDVEAQGKLYEEQAQMLQEFADDITADKEKYTTEIEEARQAQKKLVRENDGLQALLSDVQSSLDGGAGIQQRLFEENSVLEKEVAELEQLLKQAATTLKNKPASQTKKEAAQAKAITNLQSDNTRLMNEISKLQTKMVEAVAKQQAAQAEAAAAGVDEEEVNVAKAMRGELKDLQKMLKAVDKKVAKKAPKKKAEVAELKALEAAGKKLTATLKKARAEKKALAEKKAKQPKPEPPKEVDPAVLAALEAEAKQLAEDLATAEAEVEAAGKSDEGGAPAGDGPTMEDLRELVAKIKAGDEEVDAAKKEIKKIDKAIAESKAEGGSVDDKLKKVRKATRLVKEELATVEKEAKKQEARNQDQLKKARKKYGGVGKVAKKVLTAFQALKSTVKGMGDDMREIFDDHLPFATGRLQKLLDRVSGSGDDANKAIAKYNKEFMLRKGYHNKLQELRGNIRVFARCRPILPFEKKRGATVCVDFPMPDTLTVKDEKRNTTNSWEFDKVFKPGSENADVFKEIAPLVTSILDGYNVCIFAYGQTGAGKTYTMEGKGEDKGLNWRTLDLLFALKEKREKQFGINIEMSFLEIYNEEIKDLLNSKKKGDAKLKVKQMKGGGNEIVGLVKKAVNSVPDLDRYVEEGKKRRTCKKTKMNDSSSRSHAVLSIYCSCLNKMSKKTMSGKLHLIDLAGSERLDKSGATGQALKEAIHINKSLSALGDVIAARANKSGHCPYRNSALTHVLEDSLAGDSKTLMLSQISPATDNAQESACTLRFASRVRKVELGRASAHGDGGGGSK